MCVSELCEFLSFGTYGSDGSFILVTHINEFSYDLAILYSIYQYTIKTDNAFHVLLCIIHW